MKRHLYINIIHCRYRWNVFYVQRLTASQISRRHVNTISEQTGEPELLSAISALSICIFTPFFIQKVINDADRHYIFLERSLVHLCRLVLDTGSPSSRTFCDAHGRLDQRIPQIRLRIKVLRQQETGNRYILLPWTSKNCQMISMYPYLRPWLWCCPT